MAGHQDQHAGGDELVGVHRSGAFRLDQNGNEIVLGAVLPLVLQGCQVFVELCGVGLGDQLAYVRPIDIEELDDVFGPDTQLGTVFIGNAEQAADDMAGHMGCEIIDKIDLAAIGKTVDQPVDIGLDLVAQLGDHCRREEFEHLPAQPVVYGAVAVEQAELHEARVVRHVVPVAGTLDPGDFFRRRDVRASGPCACP